MTTATQKTPQVRERILASEAETAAQRTDSKAGPGGEADLVAVIQRYNDVTERLKRSHETIGREVCRLREELRQKNKELQRRERLAALGEMAAGVAHEIRNPLGAIRLYASLLERDLADRPEQLELVRRLDTGVRNLEHTVGDILDFAGEVDRTHTPKKVRLPQILNGALTQAAPQANARNVTIDVDPSLMRVELYCDAGQIERALLNLILNAVDAVEEGGQVRIRAGDVRRPENLWDRPSGVGWAVPTLPAPETPSHNGLFHIFVEDDGPGIEPALLQRVFNPFFTTKHTGTGLGLAIVHRIAESNGGCVRAGHREGGGAVFVLSIPMASEGGRVGTAHQPDSAHHS